MGTLGYYLIIINIIGFLLYAINTWLRSKTEKGLLDKIQTILALLGGSLGMLISILIFDRKAAKDNMMSRVFVVCVLVIQIIILLILNGAHEEKLNFAFGEFFEKNRILTIYLVAINIIAFVAFAVDKFAAMKGWSRIKNVTLLGMCFIGGSIGGLGAMYLFHHKTNKERNKFYVVGVPLMIVMQVVVIFYVMNL